MTLVIEKIWPAVSSVVFTTMDGFVLAGRRYRLAEKVKGRIVIAGATAVRQERYRDFAVYAAREGFEVLTFDYRGVGMSRPANLASFDLDLLSWGKMDLAAAIALMSGQGEQVFVIGHAAGGRAAGWLPNHTSVAGLYTFGTGAGWHGYMREAARIRLHALWQVVLPLLSEWKGYCPLSLVSSRDDLPISAFEQWRAWSRHPRYYFDDPSVTGAAERFASIRFPIVAVNAMDDEWAPPLSRDAFMAAYVSANVDKIDADPARIGAEIGHLGYFEPKAWPLWRDAVAWCAAIRAKSMPAA